MTYEVDVLRRDPEAGAIAIMLPVLAVALFAMAGLVIDGGTALAARGRAADVAQEAARAGADQLTATSLRRGDPSRLTLDPAAATLAARQIMDASQVTGQVQVSGDTVTVQARTVKRTAMLSAVGIDTVSGHASATATVLYGGTTDATGR